MRAQDHLSFHLLWIRRMRRNISFSPCKEDIIGPGIQKIKTWEILGCSLKDSVIMPVDER